MIYGDVSIFIRDPDDPSHSLFYTFGNSTTPRGNFSICWQQGITKQNKKKRNE